MCICCIFCKDNGHFLTTLQYAPTTWTTYRTLINMKKKSTFGFGAIALGMLIAGQALAADEYQALLKDRKFSEVEKAATAKLAKDPADANAMIARTMAILGMRDGRYEEAASQAEKCIGKHPNNGGCHLALGKALGSKAVAGGVTSALGYAGTIRDSFKKAVELNPRDFEARFALLDYYLMAPFIVGGGTGKAEALARETANLNAEAAKLMTVSLNLKDDNLAKAEAGALAIKPGNEESIQERHEEQLMAVGSTHLSEKKYGDAMRVFGEAQKRYPDSPVIAYGIARVHQEQGKHREAIAIFDQVVVKTPLPHVHYRMAKSLQALGDKAKATAAFEKALSFKTGLAKSMRSDAEEQLKTLKS
jgi:tetratricopeptide (TPR) repeat protein